VGAGAPILITRVRVVPRPFRAVRCGVAGIGSREPGIGVTGVGLRPGIARLRAALTGPAVLLRGAPRVPRTPRITVRAALRGIYHSGQVGDRQPERPGAGAALPNAEHGYPRVRVPAQPHAARFAPDVKVHLA